MTRAMLTIFLARHGETEWNRLRRMQGWIDIPLSESGRAQAQLLATSLRDIQFDAIYCSALQRSRQTAEVVARGKGVTFMPELNERGLGKYEGETLNHDDVDFLAEFRRRCTDPDDSLDGGESYNTHRDRIQHAVALIRRQHANGRVLIIGHGGTNQLILQTLLQLPLSDLGKWAQRNTDTFVIELPDQESPRFWPSLEEYSGRAGV